MIGNMFDNAPAGAVGAPNQDTVEAVPGAGTKELIQKDTVFYHEGKEVYRYEGEITEDKRGFVEASIKQKTGFKMNDLTQKVEDSFTDEQKDQLSLAGIKVEEE